MTFPIRFYNSAMADAPQLTNAWGTLTTMLDAVLVNGFNSKTVSSMTRTGTVVTVNFAAAHGYIVEQIIRISSANETDYNGDKKVKSVPTSTSLTFDIDTTPTTPATGTITALTSPLGWGISQTGTDRRVYKTLTPTASSLSLRVNNQYNAIWNANYAKFGKISAARDFSDVDTPIGRTIPDAYVRNDQAGGSGSSAYNGLYKWYYNRYGIPPYDELTQSGGGAIPVEPWTLIGDDRGFYLFINNANANSFYCFTEFESYKTNDTGNTLMMSHYITQTANATGISLYNSYAESIQSGSTVGKLLFSDELGFSSVGASFFSLGGKSSGYFESGIDTGVSYPNLTTNGVLLYPCYIQQANGSVRGIMPGLKWIINNVGNSIANNTIITLDGKTYLFMTAPSRTGNNGKVAFDLTGNSFNSWY